MPTIQGRPHFAGYPTDARRLPLDDGVLWAPLGDGRESPLTMSRSLARRILLTALAALLTGSAIAKSQVGRVVGVTDGDTVTLLVGGRIQQRIRLAGIDAPENAQPFGSRAKQRLSTLVIGKTVTVVGEKQDRYHRLIGKILVDGQDANLEMVASGYAWHYKTYEAEQSPIDRVTYGRHEREARSGRRGLWADTSPVAPWDYRTRSHKAVSARIIPKKIESHLRA